MTEDRDRGASGSTGSDISNIFAEPPTDAGADADAAAEALRRRIAARRAAAREAAAEVGRADRAPEPEPAPRAAPAEEGPPPRPEAPERPAGPELRMAPPGGAPAVRGAPSSGAPARGASAPATAPARGGGPPAPPPAPQASGPADAARRFPAGGANRLGFFGVLLLVAGLGGWGAFANISGAVIAPGKVEVETRQQVVQHPDGGVVGEIVARDGDRVAPGDVLLRLDDTLLRSEETILDDQYWELVARRNRLEAEQYRSDAISFDATVLERAEGDPKVAEMVQGQQHLFETRNRSEAEQIEQLRERQSQIREQIGGAEAQVAALARQRELIAQELEGQQRLFDQGLAQLTRVLSLQREEARLGGQVGELRATIAEARGRLAEIEIQILQTSTQRQEQAISELRDIRYQENQVREQLVSVREQLARMDVRAPIGGVVFGSTVFAVRSVVRPAEPILYIVPSDVEFIITAQVETMNIDQVYPGQPATLRFSAFSSRTTPEISGHVVRVSADAVVDEQRGVSYYTAELGVDEGEMEKLAGLTLVPGMPVEAYIRTADRTPLGYLVKPLADYFSRAMREE